MAQKSLAEWYEETYRKKSPAITQPADSVPVTPQAIISESDVTKGLAAETATDELIISAAVTTEDEAVDLATEQSERAEIESADAETEVVESAELETAEDVKIDLVEQEVADSLTSEPTNLTESLVEDDID
jgi:hypothetical protein